MTRGYFGIGIENTKNKFNFGTLVRSAGIFGADFIFTIGRRFQQERSDTQKVWRHTPVFHFEALGDFMKSAPFCSRLVGIELTEDAAPIRTYQHPERAVYLLGAEDHGLSAEAMKACHDIIKIPGERSLNVATAGSIVLFDRINKAEI